MNPVDLPVHLTFERDIKMDKLHTHPPGSFPGWLLLSQNYGIKSYHLSCSETHISSLSENFKFISLVFLCGRNKQVILSFCASYAWKSCTFCYLKSVHMDCIKIFSENSLPRKCLFYKFGCSLLLDKETT